MDLEGKVIHSADNGRVEKLISIDTLAGEVEAGKFNSLVRFDDGTNFKSRLVRKQAKMV